jgi:hemoglobin/transferrin/lactoferrin receptor protein
MKKLLLASTIVAFSATSFAADNTKQATAKAKASTPQTEQAKKKISKLEKVTVYATKTEQDVLKVPSMVSVVDNDTAGVSGSGKVSDLLKNVSGLEFTGGPVRSGETPNLRGFDSTSILITVDGRKQNYESVHDGRVFIEPSLIKKVEVVKGPTSSIYGGGAIGGVMAFETKDAKDFLRDGETEGAETSAGYQSGNQEISVTQTAYKKDKNYDAVASVTIRDSGEYDLSNNTEQRSNDQITSGLAKVSYFVDDATTLKLAFNKFLNNAKENTNPQAGAGAPSGRNLVKKDIYSDDTSLKYEYNPDSKMIDLKTHVYFVRTGVDEKIVEGTSQNPRGSKLERTIETFGLSADNTSTFDIAKVTYGVDYYRNDQDGFQSNAAGGTRAGVPDANSDFIGTYAQSEFEFAGFSDRDSFYITPGGRFDRYRNSLDNHTRASQDDERFSPKLATRYQYENISLFGSYAEAFRAPNLTEIYASGLHFPGNNFVSNTSLRPETAKTFEVGTAVDFDSVVKKDDKLTFKAARYITSAEDYIDQQIAFTTTQFVNVAKAHIWGYEVELNYENDAIIWQNSVAYVSGENANTGAHLGTKTPLVFHTDFGYKLPDSDLTLGYQGKYSDGLDKALVVSSLAIDNRRDGYAIHGVYARYTPAKLNNLTLDFGVDNILDSKYQETFAELYELGRSYYVKATYKW